jgi:RNA polymerase sigma-70 factor, ECF subfamily
VSDFSIGGNRKPHLAKVTQATAQPCPTAGLSEATVKRAQAMDTKRLRTAMRDHLKMVWRIVRRSGLEPRDADEATQDVFLILSKRLGDVVIEAQKSFLVQTALRVASERRRAIRRFPEVELDAEPRSPSAAVDEVVALQRARFLLDEALVSLSEEQRATFILIEMEQMTMPEAAEILGIPVGTVASRLRSARQHFDSATRRIHLREQAREP